MTKLLYVHNIAMPGSEANTVNVAKMCNAFAANGCEVTLAAPINASGDVRTHYGLREDFDIAPLSTACRRPSVAALASVNAARRIGADLVYTRTPHVALAACLAGHATVLEAHTDLSAFSPLGRTAFRRAISHPRFRRLIVISQSLAEDLSPLVSGRPDLITVAHDGADAHENPTAESRNQRFTAGFLGRFYPGKGVELIAQIAHLCPWAEFHLAGGDEIDAISLAGVLPSNVKCRGSVPHAHTTELFSAWDVALAPYQPTVIVADGRTNAARWMSPLKLFEYMAASKAILASNLPAIREILTDRQTALLLPPEDPQAWADALARLRDHTSLRNALAQAALQKFVQRHTWRQRAQTILDAVA